jgi:hypothetical protein
MDNHYVKAGSDEIITLREPAYFHERDESPTWAMVIHVYIAD